jgi:hypothetical protein
MCTPSPRASQQRRESSSGAVDLFGSGYRVRLQMQSWRGLAPKLKMTAELVDGFHNVGIID